MSSLSIDNNYESTRGLLAVPLTDPRGEGLGVPTSSLFENMGLVIRPTLRGNSKGGVGMERNCFGDSTVQKVLNSSPTFG